MSFFAYIFEFSTQTFFIISYFSIIVNHFYSFWEIILHIHLMVLF